MGGRGAFAAGSPVPYSYQTVGTIEGVKVLHYHTYDDRFSKNKTGAFSRSNAAFLSAEMIKKYRKFFKGVKGV